MSKNYAIGVNKGILFYMSEELFLEVSGADILCKLQDELLKRQHQEKRSRRRNQMVDYFASLKGWNIHYTDLDEFLTFEYFKRK